MTDSAIANDLNSILTDNLVLNVQTDRYHKMTIVVDMIKADEDITEDEIFDFFNDSGIVDGELGQLFQKIQDDFEPLMVEVQMDSFQGVCVLTCHLEDGDETDLHL